MQLIDGKKTAAELRAKLAVRVAEAVKKHGDPIGLAVVLVGNDPASKIYTANKVKACKETGVDSYMYDLPDGTPQEEIIALVGRLNCDPNINGILVQLPLPKGYDENAVLKHIDVAKDVDGYSAYQIGLLNLGKPGLIACTPMGVLALLDQYQIPLEAKDAVVLGRSNVVGKPIAQLLLSRNATVTVCHSRTKDIAAHTRRADVLVVAIGKPKAVTADMVKEGAVVIDVGINRNEEGLCGDVDFAKVAPKCSFITPVPGGVGPMTIAMLLTNTLAAYLQQHGN